MRVNTVLEPCCTKVAPVYLLGGLLHLGNDAFMTGCPLNDWLFYVVHTTVLKGLPSTCPISFLGQQRLVYYYCY